MTERQQFENKKVFLWGLKQAKKSLLNEFDKGDQHPSRRQRQQRQVQQAPQRPREFEVGEDYGVDDLPFLNREYDRIDREIGQTVDIDIMTELEDKQERLYDLIEGLEGLQRMRGNGFDTTTEDDTIGGFINIPKHIKNKMISSIEPHGEDAFYNKKIDINETSSLKPSSGKGFKKGSPEALAHAEKMRKALEAKKSNVEKEKVVRKTVSSKARVEKGSEEAKALGKRMAEAKKRKMEELKRIKEEEEAKKPKPKEILKGKPYYYIGDIPQGYREATEQEAIKNNKISEYGKYVVDSEMLRYFRDYGILLNPQADEAEIRVMLIVLKKKTLRALEDVEIFESKLDNPKYDDRKEEFKNKLTIAKDQRKVYNAMYNFYWRLWCELKGLEYKRIKIERPKQEIIKTSKVENEYIPKEEQPVIDPRTGKPVPKRTVEEIEKGIEKQEYYDFENDGKTYQLKTLYFDKNKILKPKYAKKLYEKKILLLPKFYTKEDQKKYFYDMIGGGILSITGLQKAFTGFNWLKEKAIETGERVLSSAKGYLLGRGDNFAPYVKNIIEKYGDIPISNITISRNPVQHAIVGLINALSLGKFGKRMERKGYDELFHLRLILTLENGKKIAIEKNEKINMEENPKKASDAEYMDIINIPNGITLNSLLIGASEIQGDNFHKYSAHSNNCQDFVMALLKGSNIGDDEDYRFIKQDTEELFNHYGYLKNIADYTTDMAGRFNEIIHGAGNNKYKSKLSNNKYMEKTGGKIRLSKSLAKVAKTLNPMTYALGNKTSRDAMIKSGQFTQNYALPAVVEAGKPLYYGTAGLASTALTGNPALGMLAAKQLWNTMGEPYDPSKRQQSKELGMLSKKVGETGNKKLMVGYSQGEGVKKRKRGRPKKIRKVEVVEKLPYEEFSHSKNTALNQLLKAKKRKEDEETKKTMKEFSKRGIDALDILGLGVKKPSSWIEHVKNYAKENNLSYKDAMKEAKSTYKKN